MDINQVIQKVPKPVLVLAVLCIALGLFVYNDPLKNECEVQAAVFEKRVSGLLISTKLGKRTQFSQIKNYLSARCKEGNSMGACYEYLEALRVVVRELRAMSDKCQVEYSIKNENFLPQISNALQIIALVAWGDKPPAGLKERLGWLEPSQIQTFCYLKQFFIQMSDEETYLKLRSKVYREFPDAWSENTSIDDRTAENRPRAMKSESNPSGKLTEGDIYQRSIFSMNCNSYM